MQTDGVHHIVGVPGHEDDVRVGIDHFDAVRKLYPRHIVHLDIAENDVGFYDARFQRLQRHQGIAKQIYFRVRLDFLNGIRQRFQRQRFVVYCYNDHFFNFLANSSAVGT